ncbi:hypothetical protein E2C01_057599 [Portunus trituberculatus]|uniref:Uncharacterized protein n=1 Tax=Portunus trituberculatus TaxID=210409 RepID=A0A5B7GTD1_PORTR|nr:hypothetical protein [Portunus trituberculatus]
MPYLYQYPSSQYLKGSGWSSSRLYTALHRRSDDFPVIKFVTFTTIQLTTIVSLVVMAELRTQMSLCSASVHLSAQLCPAYEYI